MFGAVVLRLVWLVNAPPRCACNTWKTPTCCLWVVWWWLWQWNTGTCTSESLSEYYSLSEFGQHCEWTCRSDDSKEKETSPTEHFLDWIAHFRVQNIHSKIDWDWSMACMTMEVIMWLYCLSKEKKRQAKKYVFEKKKRLKAKIMVSKCLSLTTPLCSHCHSFQIWNFCLELLNVIT